MQVGEPPTYLKVPHVLCVSETCIIHEQFHCLCGVPQQKLSQRVPKGTASLNEEQYEMTMNKLAI